MVVEARKPLTVVMPLRHSWSERTLLPDSVAAEIQAKMSDCHRQVHFNLQPKRGYGASLNVWMGALCVAMQQNMSLVRSRAPLHISANYSSQELCLALMSHGVDVCR